MPRSFLSKGSIWFLCPGCRIHHGAIVDGSRGWSWNGDADRPTITPSVRVNGEIGGEPISCHSFVANGRIEFLSDCIHEFAGKTIDLPEWTGFCHIPGAISK